ncbi:MAG TPA: site-specific integrase [Blastocatellia bacterium]|nr:site-specific integrase [Blastocatellia bacterium]
MPVRKRGDNWYFDIRINGVRHRDLIPHARTKKQAEEAEIAFRQELYEARFKPKVENVPLLSDFIDEHFLPWSRANKKSWHTDRWRSKSLKKFFAGRRLDEITPLLIEKFKSKEFEKISARGTRQSPASVNRKLELLSRMLSMAVDYGMIQSNPCQRVRKFRLDNRRERYLSVEEENRLLSVLIGQKAYLRPIVILALYTGMRRGEILNMEWWQIDFSSDRLIVTKTKSGKPRHIPMNRIVRETLLAVKEESDGKLVFESRKKPGHPISDPKKGFHGALKDAEIENFRFHDLRHTAGTRLAEAGADAFTIKDILGHASIQTSAIYVHATDEGKRRALTALGQYAERLGHKLVTNEKEQIG